MMPLALLLALSLLATSSLAQPMATPPLPLAQVQQAPVPARGAAGSGSMGIGEGIRQENQPTGRDDERTPSLAPAREPMHRDSEPQHGDTTSMEHHKRPTLRERNADR